MNARNHLYPKVYASNTHVNARITPVSRFGDIIPPDVVYLALHHPDVVYMVTAECTNYTAECTNYWYVCPECSYV